MHVAIPDLPKDYQFMKPFIADAKGPDGIREIDALELAGIEDDDRERYDLFRAVAHFTCFRRCVKPQPFARAFAEENIDADGWVEITSLTSILRGGRQVRPVTTKCYRVRDGRANKRATKRPGHIVARIDIRKIQLAQADQPDIEVVA